MPPKDGNDALEALRKMPTFVGTWGRGECEIKELQSKDGRRKIKGADVFNKWCTGEFAQYRNKGFVHGSIVPDKVWNKGFKVFMKLNGTHGGWVDPISTCKGEMEYILEPGIVYRVIGVGYNKSKTKGFLILEDVKPGDIIPTSQDPPPVYDYDTFMGEWRKEWQKKGDS